MSGRSQSYVHTRLLIAENKMSSRNTTRKRGSLIRANIGPNRYHLNIETTVEDDFAYVSKIFFINLWSVLYYSHIVIKNNYYLIVLH
jgi:hypothetical protein